MEWVVDELRLAVRPLLNTFNIRLLDSLEDFINSQDTQVAALSNTERYTEDNRTLSCEITLYLKVKSNALSFDDFNVLISRLKSIRGDRYTVRRLTNILRTADDRAGVSVVEITVEVAYVFY